MITIDPNAPPGCLDSEREESLGLLSLSLQGFTYVAPSVMEEINGSMWLEPRSPRKRYMRWVQGIKPSASLSLLCSRLPASGTWPVAGLCIGQALTLKIGVAVPQLKPSACPVLAVCAAVSPHLYTLSYIQPFSHTCTHTYSRFHTPVHTVIHTAVSPHLYTLSYIQPFPHTCTHCHTYSRFPTPVHTVIHTAVSPHLYILSYIQLFPHTCTHCHTYIPTALQLFPHTCTHCHTYIPTALQLFPHACTCITSYMQVLCYQHSYLWDFSSGVCHMKVTAGQSSPDMGCLTWPIFGCGPSPLSTDRQ